MYFDKLQKRTEDKILLLGYIAFCTKGYVLIIPNRKQYTDKSTSKPKWIWYVSLSSSYTSNDSSLRFSGYCDTLYEAARLALQRLFSQRKQPLYKLMKMLVIKQAVYYIANTDGNDLFKSLTAIEYLWG